jgi:hypothetical protein
MNEILAMPKRREILKVILHLTRPENRKEIISPSSTVQMFPGRRKFPSPPASTSQYLTLYSQLRRHHIC